MARRIDEESLKFCYKKGFMNDTSRSPNTANRPLRVLHIAAMLHSGGVERWLVDLCPAGRSNDILMDIAVLFETDGLFARKARELGIRVFHCPSARKPIEFMSNLRALLRQYGPYDAVHAHIHAFSAFAVMAARMEGVPARLVHSHNVVGNQQSLFRRAYISITRMCIRRFATAGLAPSHDSAKDLFGKRWSKDPRWRVMRYGIDYSAFCAPAAASIRNELGIPSGAFVFGSVGRLCGEKNSDFMVDMLEAIIGAGRDAYLVIIGEGPMREWLEKKATSMGIRDRLILPGTRSDVPSVMGSLFDVFVFPSPPPPRGNEALPIAIVEAQAAGLPTLISDGVTPEAIIVPDLVTQLPVAAGAGQWAQVLLSLDIGNKDGRSERALSIVQNSEFSCTHNLQTLRPLYSLGNRPLIWRA